MDYQKWTFYVLCFLAVEHFAATIYMLVRQNKYKNKDEEGKQFWCDNLAQLTQLQGDLSKITEYVVTNANTMVENFLVINKEQHKMCREIIAELDKKENEK